jgi:hypothetical protein
MRTRDSLEPSGHVRGPSDFISAITKLTKKGNLMNGEFYTSLDERIRFIREMVEIVKARRASYRSGMSSMTRGFPRMVPI